MRFISGPHQQDAIDRFNAGNALHVAVGVDEVHNFLRAHAAKFNFIRGCSHDSGFRVGESRRINNAHAGRSIDRAGEILVMSGRDGLLLDPRLTRGSSLFSRLEITNAVLPDFCEPRLIAAGVEAKDPAYGFDASAPLLYGLAPVADVGLYVDVAQHIPATIFDARHAIAGFSASAQMNLAAGNPDRIPLSKRQTPPNSSGGGGRALLLKGPMRSVGAQLPQQFNVHAPLGFPMGDSGGFYAMLRCITVSNANRQTAIVASNAVTQENLPNAFSGYAVLLTNLGKRQTLSVHIGHHRDSRNSLRRFGGTALHATTGTRNLSHSGSAFSFPPVTASIWSCRSAGGYSPHVQTLLGTMPSARAIADCDPKWSLASEVFMDRDYGAAHMGRPICFNYQKATLADMEPIGDTVGARVKALRGKRSQTQVAKEAGVDQSVISDIEGGAAFKAGVLMGLCDALSTTPEYLMRGNVSDDKLARDVAQATKLLSGMTPEARTIALASLAGIAGSKPTTETPVAQKSDAHTAKPKKNVSGGIGRGFKTAEHNTKKRGAKK